MPWASSSGGGFWGGVNARTAFGPHAMGFFFGGGFWGPHAMGFFFRGGFWGGVNARTAFGPHAMGFFFRGAFGAA